MNRLCPRCQAQQPGRKNICWLCGAELSASVDQAPADQAVRSDRVSFSLSTLFLVFTLVTVCCGLLVVAPGLGIPVCVLLVPVLIRTTMVVRRREAAGVQVSRLEKMSLMTSSFGVATVLAVVVASAAFSGFCGVCLLMVSPDQRYGGPLILLWGAGMCLLAAVAVWLTVRVVKWIRRRYRRDIGRQD